MGREYSTDKRLCNYEPGSYALSFNRYRMLSRYRLTPSLLHLHGLRQSSMCFRSTLPGTSMARLACFSVSSYTMPPMPPSVLAGRVSLFYILTASKPIRLLAIRPAQAMLGLCHTLSHTLGHTLGHTVCPPSTVVSYRENSHTARRRARPSIASPPQWPAKARNRPAKARKRARCYPRSHPAQKARLGPLIQPHQNGAWTGPAGP